MSDQSERLVPVTVLTGYLGAGKTSLLNSLLSQLPRQRVAVIENEFGAIGVDHEFVIGVDEEVLTTNSSCLCCTVRSDLVRILGNLAKRKDRFDHVLVETTGVADPSPIAQTFFVEEDVHRHFVLDAIVTVVDSENLWRHVDDSTEARDQIAYADVIVLNKTDLVSPEDLDRVEHRVRVINHLATVHRTTRSMIEPSQVLNRGGFDMDRALEITPNFLEADHRDDVEPVASVSFALAGDVDADRVTAWFNDLLSERGEDIFRAKGLLSLAGDDRQWGFQGVHHRFEATPVGAWPDGEMRGNTLVFIGRDLDQRALSTSFRSCLV